MDNPDTQKRIFRTTAEMWAARLPPPVLPPRGEGWKRAPAAHGWRAPSLLLASSPAIRSAMLAEQPPPRPRAKGKDRNHPLAPWIGGGDARSAKEWVYAPARPRKTRTVRGAERFARLHFLFKQGKSYPLDRGEATP